MPILLEPASPFGRLPYISWGVKVLDIIRQRPELELQLQYFNHVQTVRRFSDAWNDQAINSLSSINTIVDFIMLPHDSADGSIQINTPCGPSRFVLHIKYDVSLVDHSAHTSTIIKASSHFNSVPNHHNLTFVLWPCCPADKTPRERQLLFLHHAIWSLLQHYDGTTDIAITIVGTENVPECQLDDSAEDFIEAIMSMGPPPSSIVIYGVFKWKLDPALIDIVRRAFRFITLEEWWQELGDKKDIVGVWPEAPWA